jgi:hypothetical protein
MKTGVERSVYAILLLNMLPDKAVLPGEASSQQLGASATYFQKLLKDSRRFITQVVFLAICLSYKKKINVVC